MARVTLECNVYLLKTHMYILRHLFTYMYGHVILIISLYTAVCLSMYQEFVKGFIMVAELHCTVAALLCAHVLSHTQQ
jgi:hypothetical protein